jgi:two-component system sensor histidine kinase TctE
MMLILGLSIYADYCDALRLANDSNDKSLNAIAMQVAEGLEHRDGRGEIALELPGPSIRKERSAAPVRFALHDAKGRLLAGTSEIPTADGNTTASKHPSFHDERLGGHVVRIARYVTQAANGPGTLTLAQPTGRRDATARQLFMRSIWPNVLQVILTLAIISLGIRKGLKPLRDLGRHIASYDAERLPPLNPMDVPTEIQGLTQALDRLIATLRHNKATQQDFLANAAHQLRTPLTALQTQLELLGTRLEGAQRLRLEALLTTSQHLAHFTHQMLALAHASDQETTLTLVPMDLDTLLQDIASRFLDAALAKDMDLGFETEPVFVLGSAPLLRELLANLVDNAIRHNPAGTRITVRCVSGPEGRTNLEVEDDGPAIAPDTQSRLFERFVQGHAASNPGHGLGLAIAREIVERHQGTIHLQQEQGKPGKRFQIVLQTALSGH